MSRNIDSSMMAAITAAAGGAPLSVGFMASIAFRSETRYVFTGTGAIEYGGNTYVGIGSFGELADISEDTDTQAQGTSIKLSGIDPALLSESLTDIQLGAPVTIYFVIFDAAMNIIGVPYPIFVGQVDQPSESLDPENTISITLALENRLVNLQRATQRRYTAADQHLDYPTDTAFNWVESLNDQSLVWGN